MNSLRSRHIGALQAVQDAPDLAQVGCLATLLRAYRHPQLGRWFRAAVQSRYREFTRPGLPDGPRPMRPRLAASDRRAGHGCANL